MQQPIMPPVQTMRSQNPQPPQNGQWAHATNNAKQPQTMPPVQTKPGISPAVKALMNAQARQPAPGPRQPVPGARQVQPGQQLQNYQQLAQDRMLDPQAAAKPAAYQPPVADPSLPVTTPAPMPFMSRRDQIGMDRAQYDPSMERRMAAFGPRVR